MKNVVPDRERNRIVNMYSLRLNRSSGLLGRYYREIVDNITSESAIELLRAGIANGFSVKGTSYWDAFKVVLDYVSCYLRNYKVFSYQKHMSDFDSYYNYLCDQVDYYGKMLDDFRSENSVNAMFAKALNDSVADKYSDFTKIPLLASLNDYLINNSSDLFKCRIEHQYNILSTQKKNIETKVIYRSKKKQLYDMCSQNEAHYISDNHLK